MAKFNKAVDKTIQNHEGGVAFQLEPKQELINLTLTSMINEDKFYVSGVDEFKRFTDLIFIVSNYDPEFILKLAKYARNEFYMRTAPVVLLAEASMIEDCKPFVRQYAPQIIKRADELTEVIAYWTSAYGSIGSNGNVPFPNSLKKGVADSFNNFNEYHLTKYDRKGAVTLKDVLRICHPAPKDETQDNLFAYLADKEYDPDKLPIVKAKAKLNDFDTLNDEAIAFIKENNFTWEVLVSKFGNFKEVWDSINLPFMAMLRNLRNLIKSGANLNKYIQMLLDKNQVFASKQFPFRFYTAYREIQQLDRAVGDVRPVLNALTYAVEHSVNNLPKLPGLSIVSADVSGSMQQPVSRRGTVLCSDISLLFTAMADKICDNAIVSVFGTKFATLNTNGREDIFTLMSELEKVNVGWSTNGYLIPKYLLEKQIKVDRIIVFSDMQMYDDNNYYSEQSFKGYFNKYVAYNPDVYLYTIDLAGYGHSVVDPNNPRVVKIAGWSDKVLNLIAHYESDKSTLVKGIEES